MYNSFGLMVKRRKFVWQKINIWEQKQKRIY